MATSGFTQGSRQMTVTTPAGSDVLLLDGFTGTEQISGLYRFELTLRSKLDETVNFDTFLGQPMSIEADIPSASGDQHRYFNGICSRFAEEGADEAFKFFRAEIVPKVWLLTRQARSRIFQQKTVTQILQTILQGYDVQYQIQTTFDPREYCVQYRETDFNFMSRLMEEEGLFYFFKHTSSGHQMVVTDSGLNYPDVTGPTTISYDAVTGGEKEGTHIIGWSKTQELRSGKLTLWDNCFELPGKNLQAQKTVDSTLQVGTVSHKLKTGGNDQFEIYDYPGAYAKRYDGIDHSGGEQPSNLNKIYQDNTRTAGLRMDAETALAIIIRGVSNCLYLSAGYKFTLAGHPNANGSYYLTAISHSASGGTAFRSGETGGYAYSNSFECNPAALKFRPPRVTPCPSVNGVQTATVVGPQGDEIFTDKYGRVKVQFNWDRDGQNDANSSCWLRVATLWAGKQWGSIFIPRIGQEVVVDFIEGDPDAPIVVGSVYNQSTMPTYTLPDNKTRSGIRSKSTTQGETANFNEIRFEDKKGSEQLFIMAEKDLDFWVENDARYYVKKNKHSKVEGYVKEEIDGNVDRLMKGALSEKVQGALSLQVGSNRNTKVSSAEALEAGTTMYLKAGTNLVLEAGTMLTLKVGGSFITLSAENVTIQGPEVMINSGGAAGQGTPASPVDPQQPPDAVDDGTK